MIRITVINHGGTAHLVEGDSGTSLMEAIKAQDVAGIDAVCGGNAYCGTCRVQVAPEWQHRLTPPESFEIDLLAATGDDDTTDRLSCQIPLTAELDGLVVHTPEHQC